VSVSSSFLWRFLEDVWDLLPTADRQMFETFWSANIQIASNLEQKIIDAALSTTVATVPVFLTERWNKFAVDDNSCDLFPQSDTLTLTMFIDADLSHETALYDTLTMSSPSGQIFQEETMLFFDSSVRALRYGLLITGTVSVSSGALEYTANRDYVVNLVTGTIQALDGGRIPVSDPVTIRYSHSQYTLGLDYEIDEPNAVIRRIAGTTINSGDQVVVSYTYNGTATLPFQGTAGAVDSSTLTDPNVDFSAVRTGRVLTITDGPNAGTYHINAVPSTDQIQVVEQFPVTQATDVVYSINAFPHGIKVSKAIVSIPSLRDLVDNPTLVLVEDVDYVVQGGILSVRTGFPLASLGPTDARLRQMWAETTRVDRETPYRNFGVLIDFYRSNSEAYKLALQGLWYAFWTGSTPGNLQRGLQILLGLPFAKKAGTVTRVDTVLAVIDVTDPRGQIITYSIPTGLSPTVVRGDSVARFDSLTTGVSIIDRNNQPGFVASLLGRAGIDRFLTSNATFGPGNTDETKALTLLENHLFLPQVLTEAIVSRVNVTELVTFLDNMKPSWTEYIFSFAVSEDETITFTEDLPPNQLAFDLSTTVSNNEWDQSMAFDNFLINDSTGEIPTGGTQAAGNFRDLSVDFAALGVTTGDVVRIIGGIYQGYFEVLERFNSHLIALDIPDALITETLDLSYVLIPGERKLDHDAIKIGRENIILNGTLFSTPTTRNTKTDIDLAGSSLKDTEIVGLHLVFPSALTIQTITASTKSINEFNVAVPPTPSASPQPHQIASCTLLRTDNTGPTVTDVYAI
jgi:hypothetical protein